MISSNQTLNEPIYICDNCGESGEFGYLKIESYVGSDQSGIDVMCPNCTEILAWEGDFIQETNLRYDLQQVRENVANINTDEELEEIQEELQYVIDCLG